MEKLKLNEYGVNELSLFEQTFINGEGKWEKIKKGAEWVWKKAMETCAGNCGASWLEGFYEEMKK